MEESGILVRSLCFCLLLLNGSCTQVEQEVLKVEEKYDLPVDNAAEEAVEFIIETGIQYGTGIRPSIDLTPSSPE